MIRGQEPWGRHRDHGPISPSEPLEDPSSAATPTRDDASIIRPMPTRGDGPAFDTLSMQSALNRARDTSRFAAPETTEDTNSARRRPTLRVLVALTVSVVALGIIGGVLWVNVWREVPIDDATIVKVSRSPGEKIRTPQETVRGYLEALAAGDIRKAVEFGPSPGTGSNLLLTPEAHAGMPEGARPSNINVLTDDPLATEVDVTYTLAGEQVATTMQLNRDDDSGSFELEQSTVTIQLQVVGGENLPMRINGVEVDNRLSFKVVPGTYIPTTELPFLAFPESSSITISSLAKTELDVYTVNPEITPEGHAALFDAARKSLDRCIASTELTPSGCPNAIGARQPVVPGSVVWTNANRSSVWKSFTPTLSSADQTVAVATVSLELSATMQYVDGGTSGNSDVPRTVVLRATMLGRDPASVTVSWER